VTEQIKFEQRRFFTKLQYQIVSDGINFRESSVFSARQNKVPFENIPQEPSEVTTSAKWLFWVTVFLLSLSILMGILYLSGQNVESDAFIFWGILGLFTGICFITSRKHFLVYRLRNDKQALVFFKDKPTKELLRQFIITMHNQQREYLRQHYLIGSESAASVDAIQKLLWLKAQNAINEDEFAKLKQDVIEKTKWGNVQPPSVN
jgi:hypothetical protein